MTAVFVAPHTNLLLAVALQWKEHIYWVLGFINQSASIVFYGKSLECCFVSCAGHCREPSPQLQHVSPLSGWRWFQLKYLYLNVVKAASRSRKCLQLEQWCHREHKDLLCVDLLLINCFLKTSELNPPQTNGPEALTKRVLLCFYSQVRPLHVMLSRCGI